MDIVKVDKSKTSEIDKIAKECNINALMANEELGEFERAATVAKAMVMLRRAFTPELTKGLMELQGNPLGFMTDREYDEKTVRECFIDATLRGIKPIQNQFNIIGGRMYITREGLTHILANYPGLTDLDITPSPPRRNGESEAIVQMRASWKLNGVPQRIEREIPIRVNRGMGSDAILGKANRKMRAAILERITGTGIPEGDSQDPVEVEYTNTASSDATAAEARLFRDHKEPPVEYTGDLLDDEGHKKGAYDQ